MKKRKFTKIKKHAVRVGKKQILGFIGAGNMARAMMKSLHGHWDLAATDIDGKKIEEVREKFRVQKTASIEELVNRSDVIIIAVKPDNIAEVLNEIKPAMTAEKTIVSIVAGLTIKKIQDTLGKVSIVRVMPNTPVLVNEGVCAYSLGDGYNGGNIAMLILQQTCRVAIQMNEDKINAVTAISGSGPAYFFYIAEAMVAAGLEMGLDGGHLRDLIGQTLKGAGEMILKNTEAPDLLRARVTSKGGTTEQAIKVMDDMHMKAIVIDAIRAAKRRADEMGG